MSSSASTSPAVVDLTTDADVSIMEPAVPKGRASVLFAKLAAQRPSLPDHEDNFAVPRGRAKPRVKRSHTSETVMSFHGVSTPMAGTSASSAQETFSRFVISIHPCSIFLRYDRNDGFIMYIDWQCEEAT